MQIRYQNVRKNITYMPVSFAFMKKVLENAHPSFSSYATTMNSKILKSSKNWKKIGGKEWQMFYVPAKFHQGITFVGVVAKKNNQHSKIDYFFATTSTNVVP